MAIATLSLTQQQSYQQTSNQSRSLTLLKSADVMQNSADTAQTEPVNSLANPIFKNNILNKLFTSIQDPQIEASQIELEEDATYQKPEIKLQLMVLVLEKFLDRSLDISSFHLNTKNESTDITNFNLSSVNQLSVADYSSTTNAETANTELVNIDGQSFQLTDIIEVEQWHSHKQQLNYQVKGAFNVNEQTVSLNYNFALSSEQMSYSKIEMSAAALKDPLIVQFGNQGLGNITGQHSFHINQDDQIDNLPVFSGDVGYLVYDENNNQQADNGSELFGPTTGQGFAELAMFDSNKDGFITTDDEKFEQLYLWQPSIGKNKGDGNSNGEQWLSLKEAQIQAISLSAVNTHFDFYDQQGQVQAQLRQSSFAISDHGEGRGVHQVDVRI